MELSDFSNPSQVYANAKKIFGNDVLIKPSTRKDKKHMLFNPISQKWIPFGKFGMEDYTRHKGEQRRINFKNRNHKWKNSNKYSPSYLSYYLLW